MKESLEVKQVIEIAMAISGLFTILAGIFFKYIFGDLVANSLKQDAACNAHIQQKIKELTDPEFGVLDRRGQNRSADIKELKDEVSSLTAVLDKAVDELAGVIVFIQFTFERSTKFINWFIENQTDESFKFDDEMSKMSTNDPMLERKAKLVERIFSISPVKQAIKRQIDINKSEKNYKDTNPRYDTNR